MSLCFSVECEGARLQDVPSQYGWLAIKFVRHLKRRAESDSMSSLAKRGGTLTRADCRLPMVLDRTLEGTDKIQ